MDIPVGCLVLMRLAAAATAATVATTMAATAVAVRACLFLLEGTHPSRACCTSLGQRGRDRKNALHQPGQKQVALRRHGADLKGGLGGGWASTARRQDAPHPSAQADDGRCPPDAAHGGCANRGGRRVVRAEKK